MKKIFFIVFVLVGLKSFGQDVNIFKGANKYDLNYVSRFTARSIVDKNYIDSLRNKARDSVVALIPAAGVTTMAAIGSSANANGASISGVTLTLQPASSSFGGVLTTGTQDIAGAKTATTSLVSPLLGASTQITAGTTTLSQVYRTTNGGSNITPQLFVGNATVTAGTLAVGIDNTNMLTFSAANGTRQIARGAIKIDGLDNTAGAEEGDLVFYTKPTTGAMVEAMRLYSNTNLGLTAGGAFLLSGLSSGTITIKAADNAGTWTFTLPTDDGDANSVLMTDGNGVTSWSNNITSGTYSPTGSDETNVASKTIYTAQYMRVGNTVTVSGIIVIATTATGGTSISLTLPIASDFASVVEAAGSFNRVDTNEGGHIQADAVSNKVVLSFVSTTTSSKSLSYTFTYRIS